MGISGILNKDDHYRFLVQFSKMLTLEFPRWALLCWRSLFLFYLFFKNCKITKSLPCAFTPKDTPNVNKAGSFCSSLEAEGRPLILRCGLRATGGFEFFLNGNLRLFPPSLFIFSKLKIYCYYFLWKSIALLDLAVS